MSATADSAVNDSTPAATSPWTIARVLAWAGKDLRTRGSSSGRLDAELLLGHVLCCDRVKLITDADRPLVPAELAAYRQLHLRRRRGEPVAYLIGRREFYGRRFTVDRRVLVPRPETELLVEVGLRRTASLNLCATVLDLCTGSGCVAITIAKQRPTNLVFATDISQDALAVAQDNALRLGAPIGLVRSDLFAALAPQLVFDLITANPPYIADGDFDPLPKDIRDFEPRGALAGGPDGLDIIRRIVTQAPARLSPGGVLAVEIAYDQGQRVRGLFAEAGFAQLRSDRDYGGHERVVSGRHIA